jgi:hypothetical protein
MNRIHSVLGVHKDKKDFIFYTFYYSLQNSSIRHGRRERQFDNLDFLHLFALRDVYGRRRNFVQPADAFDLFNEYASKIAVGSGGGVNFILCDNPAYIG